MCSKFWQFLCMAGLKPDGTVKVRPIDDLTASEVNKNTHAAERVTNDTLDKLVECMRDMYGRKEGGFGVSVSGVACALHAACALLGREDGPIQGRYRFSLSSNPDQTRCQQLLALLPARNT